VELDWSTFLLQIVNVLVLVWLLKRFLYQPVLTVIEERKAAIAKTVADAERVQQEANALQSRYEQRLVEWDNEKAQARTQLAEEIAAERQRSLTALRTEMDTVRGEHVARERQQLKEAVRQAEATAVLHGTQFAAALLARIASPELEARLIDAALEDLSKLHRHHVDAIASTLPTTAEGCVTTAFPLEGPRREQLVQQIEGVFGREVEWKFVVDKHLLAGLRVCLGGWMLRGNLQDELKFFAEGEAGDE
jgi:F-type H+-transporting ATPase subunit b